MTKLKHKIITSNVKETFLLGQKMANELTGGEVIGLTGNLGSGKTHFVKGIAYGLGINNPITSPTFIIHKSYKCLANHVYKKTFNHMDLYRLNDDPLSIGINMDFFFEKDHITCVEWFEKLETFFPNDVIRIFFSYVDENKRSIDFTKVKTS